MTQFPYIARYWHSLDDGSGRIQCNLCPRQCRLKSGQKGFCFVRENHDGKLILSTYGLSTGFHVDPIEKKPLYHFYPGSSILSFGTAGCNLGCQYCQNWHISHSKQVSILSDKASPKQIANRAMEMSVPAVAYTYNDPVIFLEYAADTAQACHELGIKNVAVTAGYINEKAREEFFANMDAANVDLKSFSDDFYRSYCAGHLQPVLDTLIYIKEKTSTWLEITTLLIPDYNDSEKELHALSEWIVENLGPDVPLHFSAFHPDAKFTHAERTPAKTLLQARDIAISKGMHFVYTGNIQHSESGSSYCPSCGKLLIERDYYRIEEYNINTEGKCSFCNQTVPGFFF